MRDAVTRFDNGVTQSVQSWPSWVHPIMNSVTLAGGPAAVVSLAIIGAFIARRQGNSRLVWAFTATIVASMINGFIKLFLNRTRPDTLYVTLMKFKSYSFPSGHAFGSIVLYGFLAYLAWRYLPAPFNYLLSLASVGLIALIGVSRVYLGAHFPTDVLAGWLLGGVALFIIIRYIAR